MHIHTEWQFRVSINLTCTCERAWEDDGANSQGPGQQRNKTDIRIYICSEEFQYPKQISDLFEHYVRVCNKCYSKFELKH